MYLCFMGINFPLCTIILLDYGTVPTVWCIFVFHSIYIFQLKSDTNNVIKATHTTPMKHYVDDLTFTLTASGTNCNVQVGNFKPTDNNDISYYKICKVQYES